MEDVRKDSNKTPLTPQQKSALTRGKKLSMKEKAFVKEIIKSNNGTQAALKVYDTTSENVAATIASENMLKPKIKAEIERLLEKNDVKMSDIISTHRRNMLQDEHLPTSQKAVGDFYDILGMRNTEKASTDVKIAFVIEK